MIAKYEVGSDPENFAIDKLAAKLYTANGLSDDVSVIDTATNKVIATVKAGDAPWGIAL